LKGLIMVLLINCSKNFNGKAKNWYSGMLAQRNAGIVNKCFQQMHTIYYMEIFTILSYMFRSPRTNFRSNLQRTQGYYHILYI
jgi:hypothetical protein